MSAAAPLHVTCLGLACPVGLTPESAAAAMRAGIDGYTELPYLDDEGQPIVGATVPCLAPDLRGRERLVALLELALTDLADLEPSPLGLKGLPLLLCTRELERPGPPIRGIVAELEHRLGLRFRRDGSIHLAGGPVAVFEAFSHARRMLAEGNGDACLVVAVDSLADARSLLWLARAARLKTPAQSDGVVPGEAAGALLLTRNSLSNKCKFAATGLGFAVETATVLDDKPLLGVGMAAAVRSALVDANLEMHDIDLRISDVAGESYAFEELVLAQARVMRQVREKQILWHPAASVGDCGAAASLVALAWAEQAHLRDYAPGRRAMCHASAVSGARAAAVVECQGSDHD